jgi:hypothetical protein
MADWNIIEAITNALSSVWNATVSILPNIIGAIIVLIIGYIIGRLIGGLVRKILEKTTLDNKLLKNTIVERVLKSANMSFEKMMGKLVSVFFYLIFILAAVDILGIEMLSSFVNQVLLYLPNFIAGIIILVVGLIAVEWLTKFIRSTTKEYKVISANLITMALRVILIFFIFMMALDQWMIDTSIIYTIIQPLAWGIAAAIAVAFGWGFKDVVSNWSKSKADEWKNLHK